MMDLTALENAVGLVTLRNSEFDRSRADGARIAPELSTEKLLLFIAAEAVKLHAEYLADRSLSS